ncbi:uncharacterized protein [Aegilops tauschii subsp. strangulata]|nr:SKI family transcriptional corepressor 2 [Aegilops tauschii subsp. strangulata]
MAKEEELKRVDLKVNVSCCDGCRRKVMKAMNLKGVLRTEIHPSLDRVTVVGNVDTKVLVKKLAKVGKIAEVVEAAPEQPKKREGDGGKDRDGGDWTAPAPAMAGEKSKRKEDGMDNSGDKPPAASSKKECTKCAHQKQQSPRGDGGDADDHGKKVKGTTGDERSAFKQEADGFAAEAKASAPDQAPAAVHHQYYRAEPPSMAVPMQYMPTMPYYAAANVTAPSYYNGGGYYAMPPSPPAPMPWQPPHHQQLVRPQPSRFDADYFNEDNAVGCHVM